MLEPPRVRAARELFAGGASPLSENIYQHVVDVARAIRRCCSPQAKPMFPAQSGKSRGVLDL